MSSDKVIALQEKAWKREEARFSQLKETALSSVTHRQFEDYKLCLEQQKSDSSKSCSYLMKVEFSTRFEIPHHSFTALVFAVFDLSMASFYAITGMVHPGETKELISKKYDFIIKTPIQIDTRSVPKIPKRFDE